MNQLNISVDKIDNIFISHNHSDHTGGKGNKSEDEVMEVIQILNKKDVKVAGVTPHDSCAWTIKQFRDNFGEQYKEVIVGQEIKL